MDNSDEKVVIMHGLSQDEALALMRAARAALPSLAGAAFATSTPTNLEWKLSDIVEHVGEEHRAFMEAKKGKA